MEETGKQVFKMVFGEGKHDSQDEFLCWCLSKSLSRCLRLPSQLSFTEMIPPPPPTQADGRFLFSLSSLRMCPHINFSIEELFVLFLVPGKLVCVCVREGVCL